LHNVVYVATSENWVYAFDADDLNPDEQTKPLIQVHLGAPSPVGSSIFLTSSPSNGISSTPVIDLGNPPDPSKGTLYVVAKLNQDNNFHIFGLDLNTLTIRPNAQGQSTGVIISGAAPGQNQRGKTTITFSGIHLNRPALLISNNHLVIAFGSTPPGNDWDAAAYHGWVMSYSLPNLVQSGIFVTTPTTYTAMGGIWQAGAGPAADDQGNVYVMSGNGHFQSTPGLLPDLADSFIKLENKDGALKLADWYTPPSRDVMEVCDLDLGSSGPAVIQESGRVLGAGKSGILYVLDKDAMGKDAAFDSSTAGQWTGTKDCKIGQCFRIAENHNLQSNSKQACNMQGPFLGTGFNTTNWGEVVNSYPHVHGSPVVWKKGKNDFNLYVWPEEDYLKAYHFDGRTFLETPVGSSAPLTAAMMSMPGGICRSHGTEPIHKRA
jgi:hypothetical protein